MKEKLRKTESSRGWTGRTNGGEWGQKILISLLGCLSVGASYLLMDLALPFYLPFNWKGFAATRNYFVERLGYGGVRAFWNAYRTHRNFGQMMFDRFRFFNRGAEGLDISIDGINQMVGYFDQKKGCVMAGAHVGSMEMTGYLLGIDGISVNAVVFGGENEGLQSRRAKAMEAHGVRMIPVSDDMSHLFAIKAALDAGEVVSMPCDRLFGSSKYYQTEFLGAPARFPIGAFTLAARTGCDMVGIFTMKEGRRAYRVYTRRLVVDRTDKRPGEISEALAEAYVRYLEQMVLKYPRQWFNFYDFWKFGGDE